MAELLPARVTSWREFVLGCSASGDAVPVCPDSILPNDPIGAPRSRAPIAHSPPPAPSLIETLPAGISRSTARTGPIASAAEAMPGTDCLSKSGLARPGRWVLHVISAFDRPLGLCKSTYEYLRILDCSGLGWDRDDLKFLSRRLRRWNLIA
ncbi:hypothetical protein GE21DRAFT_5019 [Neurospora crassa]|uniref:Uncharacterized protein n=1 Tax=Neurospora crassa (strain ATCC 24698 / 74-OR23-1A / CBS 708.71 / DSM 1257 / FGSC 987) TaxID=367110 RepID=Q7S3K6_NEUCR|nr:hypothetical protein NCU08237 [Neurospora crassa OR74A]EAA30091.1 hypothetical protein NCU08237 [Neurospora crassa OR74A]KHE86493.1 hypothetical protein GE21DRAFT_5019 [Neurospora crassa]|eukprot:XP_959327.1 hypothetical protein NCU08237 [Neurospora crassa OR74A]